MRARRSLELWRFKWNNNLCLNLYQNENCHTIVCFKFSQLNFILGHVCENLWFFCRNWNSIKMLTIFKEHKNYLWLNFIKFLFVNIKSRVYTHNYNFLEIENHLNNKFSNKHNELHFWIKKNIFEFSSNYSTRNKKLFSN